MKPIVFNEELTNDNIISLMDKIYSSITERSIIYFSGYGKNIAGEKMLVNFLNNLVVNLTIQSEIVAFDKLCQSAFTIFFKCALNKTILKTATGMIQLPQDIIAMKGIRKENRFMYQTYKNDNIDFIKWLQPLDFNKTEARKIRTGKPVMLDNGRLRDINIHYSKQLTEPIV